MARVLVTGGTGTLGRHLVGKLIGAGHEVRALSRRAPSSAHDRAAYVRGNVLTGEGLASATHDVDTVVHAATSPLRRVRETELTGTKNALEAARGAGAHFVYVSIVGVDRNRLPYYRTKLAAENVVESSAARWTIQRATQFHELLERFLSFPALPVTSHMAFQLLDAGDFSDRLVEIVEAGPSGHAEDFGGPEVLPVRDIASTRRRITGRRARLVRVPPLGFFGDFDRGSNLCPDRAIGTRTWEDWLLRKRDSGSSSLGNTPA